ncbi:MAG: chromate transporter [Bacteroidales bacterium]|nr:chromate transporter [Bacteroidales bacterium]
MLGLNLFWSFFKIGAFTFGGGYAMIQIVKDCVVDKNQWLSEDEFWESITLAQALPGVFAINMALYTGHKIMGKTGAFSAMMGAMLPSMIIIMVIASFFKDINEYETVRNVFSGIRPCVAALILAPGLTMLKKAKITWKTIWIPISVCLLIVLFGISPIYLILAAIIVGIISAWRFGKQKTSPTA